MNTVRERILIDIGGAKYTDLSEHRDLINFCVSSEYFIDWEEEVESAADFEEVIAIVEKDWLFDKMRHEGIDNPLNYLQNEYTTEDSGGWFDDAISAKKLICVMFN